jgi:hypothetical protein
MSEASNSMALLSGTCKSAVVSRRVVLSRGSGSSTKKAVKRSGVALRDQHRLSGWALEDSLTKKD